MKKTSSSGTLFIRYKDVRHYNKRYRTFFLRNKKTGGLNKINEECVDQKKLDSYKNVKNLERAHEIVLSHNPGNIEKAWFETYGSEILFIKISHKVIKQEKRFKVSKYTIQ